MNSTKLLFSLVAGLLIIAAVKLSRRNSGENITLRIAWHKRKKFTRDLENRFREFFEEFHKEYKNAENEDIHWDERANL